MVQINYVHVFISCRFEQCLSPITYTLEPTDTSHTGDFISQSTSGDITRIRVLHTDYNNALIATCWSLTADGYCSPGHGSVVVYTRAGAISDDTRQLMVQAANSACLSERDFVPMRTEGAIFMYLYHWISEYVELLIIANVPVLSPVEHTTIAVYFRTKFNHFISFCLITYS